MAKVSHSLLVLLAALGLLTALGWTGASLAAPPFAPPAVSQAHEAGCGHPMAHTHRHGPMTLADEMCATCCAVLPSLARIAPRALAHFAPAQASLQLLSGIDPGLDPPPPRAG
jgi:predicted metal-binding membrane protein